MSPYSGSSDLKNRVMVTYPNVKVNVGLNVLRRRPDGFHDIETLFVPYFGMTDVLEITPSDEFSISIISSKPGIPDWNPMSDLCAKAWRLMRERFGIPPVSVALEKRNPVGGGLGGGSSDAAFTLKMLNELFSLSLDEAELASLAGELGSDCPFFIYNRPMIGEGRGEILREYPLDWLDSGSMENGTEDCRAYCGGDDRTRPYVLGVIALDAHLNISTAQAYRNITPSVPPVSLREALSRDISQWRDLIKNDFQKGVCDAHPIVARTIERCYEDGAVYAAMSGSGPSVFYIRKA